MKQLDWIAFFSQTGSELFSIIQEIHCVPKIVVIHQNQQKRIVPRLLQVLQQYGCQVVEFSAKPVLSEYQSLPEAKLITLHGWLRIVPAEFCTRTIYNGHPGNILTYPELKGKDPQAKAVALRHDVIGTVIHRVTPVVDDGEVIASATCYNNSIDVGVVINVLKQLSISLWTNFLKNRFNIE